MQGSVAAGLYVILDHHIFFKNIYLHLSLNQQEDGILMVVVILYISMSLSFSVFHISHCSANLSNPPWNLFLRDSKTNFHTLLSPRQVSLSHHGIATW